MQSKSISYTLVLVQFTCIGLLLYWGLVQVSVVGMMVMAIGMITGIIAVATMKLGNFSITPEPIKQAKLVTNGIYAVIRHPMYTAVLLITLPCAIATAQWHAYLVWLALLADLIIKLRYEERMLLARYGEYDEYVKRTKRIVPFIW